MKIATVEVKVGILDKLPDAAISIAVDKMLDVGQAEMVDAVFDCANHPVIDRRGANECVRLRLGDAEVVKIDKGRPEPMEPVRTVTHLPALDDYFPESLVCQGTPATPKLLPISLEGIA